MNISVLYEDREVLAINKPPGMVVNRATTVKEATVQDWAEERLIIKKEKLKIEEEDKDFCNRAGIAHRLDKETSGVLLIAKTPQTFFALQQQFKERGIKKTYLAVVHGTVVPEEGEIRVPVGRLPWNRERFGVVPGGKEAITRYKCVKASMRQCVKGEKEEISIVELHPETGRTHQIRVHMKYINHPIVGDYLYAGRKTARSDRVWAPRVMLHAWKVSFQHPTTKKDLAIEAPIPDDMNAIIQLHGK